MRAEHEDAPRFDELGLSPPLLRAIAERGHDAPTPVQRAVIPEALRGRDVWASARTGSGKTAAFVLPILEGLARGARDDRDRSGRRLAQALIVAPTRELAIQIGDEIAAYARHLPRRPVVSVVLGGVAINPQMMALRGGADVVVATPGRLLDLVAKNALALDGVRTLVLDEADRLLDRGFAEELDRVLALLPRDRRSMLFSATFPPAVTALARAVLRDPVRVEIEPDDAATIVQRAIEVDRPRRTQLLRHLVATAGWDRVLVFVATTYATEHVAEKLRGLGIGAAALHGKLAQSTRERVLGDLRAGRLRVVVATDVAARGLDIVGLPAVVSYDLPRSPVDHLHRIGRTARAGAPGTAISFVPADGHHHLALIERRTGVAIPRERVPGFEPTEAPIEPPRTGGVKGKRPSKKDKLRAQRAREAAATPTPPTSTVSDDSPSPAPPGSRPLRRR